MSIDDVTEAIERVRVLRANAARIATTLPHPEKPFFDDNEMLRLEAEIGQMAASGFGLASVPPSRWRPFWTAAYSDWGSRQTGPAGFWAYVQARLTDTENLLLDLRRHLKDVAEERDADPER